jgi:hypothetical protein
MWAEHKPINAVMEEYMEEIRREEYPDVPSRLGAIFLCPSLSVCEREWAGDKPFIYAVDAEGETLLTSGQVFNEIIIRAQELYAERRFSEFREDKELGDLIREYWEGILTTRPGDMPEIVLNGTAEVVNLVWRFGERIHGRM